MRYLKPLILKSRYLFESVDSEVIKSYKYYDLVENMEFDRFTEFETKKLVGVMDILGCKWEHPVGNYKYSDCLFNIKRSSLGYDYLVTIMKKDDGWFLVHFIKKFGDNPYSSRTRDIYVPVEEFWKCDQIEELVEVIKKIFI